MCVFICKAHLQLKSPLYAKSITLDTIVGQQILLLQEIANQLFLVNFIKRSTSTLLTNTSQIVVSERIRNRDMQDGVLLWR